MVISEIQQKKVWEQRASLQIKAQRWIELSSNIWDESLSRCGLSSQIWDVRDRYDRRKFLKSCMHTPLLKHSLVFYYSLLQEFRNLTHVVVLRSLNLIYVLACMGYAYGLFIILSLEL